MVVRKCALHPPANHRAIGASEIPVGDETTTAHERHESQRAEARHGESTRRFGVRTKLLVVRAERAVVADGSASGLDGSTQQQDGGGEQGDGGI